MDRDGTIEAVIRTSLPTPCTLGSMARGAPFLVDEFTDEALVLVLGQGHRTPIPWAALEATVATLPTGKWIPVGSTHSHEKRPGTFEALLAEHYSARSASSYVAVVLETAGIFELDRKRPVSLRLKPGFATAIGRASQWQADRT